MADQTATIDTAPLPEVSSTFAQIAVLAALAATGTLATNILLPSLPQMAASMKVSTAWPAASSRPPAPAQPRFCRAPLPAISSAARRWLARWR